VIRRQGRYSILLLGVLCVSAGSILVRIASAHPLAVAFQRMFLAVVVLLPLGIGAGPASISRLRPRDLLMIAASGTALAAHFAAWIASLSLTSVAASVLLVNTTPFFTLLLAWGCLGERPTARLVGALALVAAGAAAVLGDDLAGGRDPVVGGGLALAGAFAYSIHHVVGRGLRRTLPLRAYLLAVWSVAAATLGLLALARGVALFAHPPRTWLALVALALVPTLGGHGLVNRSLRVLPAAVVGLFLLGEPATASFLAYLLFGERLTAFTLAGGIIILTGLGVVAAGSAIVEGEDRS
jgi:drug/metabolite transporter (DMT)-like permease